MEIYRRGQTLVFRQPSAVQDIFYSLFSPLLWLVLLLSCLGLVLAINVINLGQKKQGRFGLLDSIEWMFCTLLSIRNEDIKKDRLFFFLQALSLSKDPSTNH